MEANRLLKNQSLVKLINSLSVSQEHKESLNKVVPYLSFKERRNLLKTLTEIYLLQLEEKETLEKLRGYFKRLRSL